MSYLSPEDPVYQLFYILILVVLIFKATLSLYLAIKIYKKSKREGEFKLDFLFAVFALIVCLFISRAFYMYFDFYLTYFDPNEFWKPENIWAWNLGTLFASMGFIIMWFIIDKEALKFKLKGIPAIFLTVWGIFRYLYPVNSLEDFQFISSLGFVDMVIVAVIPMIFLYIGIKVEGLRKTAFIIVLAVLIYGVTGMMVGEHILGSLREIYGDQEAQITVYLIFVLGKIIGLSLLTYSVSKFYKAPD